MHDSYVIPETLFSLVATLTPNLDDNSWPVATKFMSIGASKIHDRRQIVMTLGGWSGSFLRVGYFERDNADPKFEDHDVQNQSPSNLNKYRKIEEFAKGQGVDFYPAGRG